MPKVEYYHYTLPVLHDKIIFASIKVSHMSGIIIMYCILLPLLQTYAIHK